MRQSPAPALRYSPSHPNPEPGSGPCAPDITAVSGRSDSDDLLQLQMSVFLPLIILMYLNILSIFWMNLHEPGASGCGVCGAEPPL
ncbi:hypothetical protein GDO81_028894 [Engystomops pustulosus]|uniref:Uncharacterized protein n=1 Tax=Engystomops pustulosus TaxID=76066 RepID=A0AAV6YEW2_ENGPU|nr:hypothetical protein GDO81_028894 [Engystomops pustulosus]